MKLVSLEVAKSHLQMDHDLDDVSIEGYIDQASAAVINYLDGAVEFEFTDTTLSELESDANGEPNAPFEVRAATLLLITMLYKGEAIDPTKWQHGYLPTPVMNLLYPLRLPAMA